MGNTIVSRTYGTLQKARRSAVQASYFIKYNLIKALTISKMAECKNLIFKGLNGRFKITATTQCITRIKDSTNEL